MKAGLVPFGGADEAVLESVAAVAIVPVPYDLTSTWKKGADRAPTAILEASTHLEMYDIPTASEPFRSGFATGEPLVCAHGPEILAGLVEARVGGLIGDGKLPVVLGGDHSVSIGPIRAAAGAVPTVTVLQLDAHADTREQYRGSAYNHACVMARAREVAPIVQVGLRSVDASEMEKLDPRRVVWAEDIIARPAADDAWIERTVDLLTGDVYVTIDVDCFDPSVVPATGTPEPGGLSWHHVDRLLRSVARQRRVVGFDVVELLPTPGQWASEFLAAKLVYRFLAEILAGRDAAETEKV